MAKSSICTKSILSPLGVNISLYVCVFLAEVSFSSSLDDIYSTKSLGISPPAICHSLDE